MLAVISVAADSFLTFSDLTCHLEDTGIRVSGCTVPPVRRETQLGSSDLEASSSAGKNTDIVLVPCLPIEVQLFPVMRVFLRSLGFIC